MKNFVQWCEENKRELPELVTDTENQEGEESTGEQRVRTGLSANYPDAYVRAQYPHKWFNPRKATTDLDLESKPKTPKS